MFLSKVKEVSRMSFLLNTQTNHSFFETMTEVHKDRKGFEKMKKEDLISECLNLNKLLSQLKDANAFLRQENNKMVDNLIDKENAKRSNQIHDNNKVQQHEQQTKFFYPNIIQRSTKTLILLDSTYKKVQAKDLSPSTIIPLYPSAKVQDLSNIVKQNNGYHKIENLIKHAGHNNIDSGNSGFEIASILKETASVTTQICTLQNTTS